MIDVYCTIYLTQLGWFELNPISRWLLQYDMTFIWIKLLASSFFAIYMWKARKYKWSNVITWIAFAPYCLLAIYYILLFMFFL